MYILATLNLISVIPACSFEIRIISYRPSARTATLTIELNIIKALDKHTQEYPTGSFYIYEPSQHE
jgi:hypothetical protein